MVAAMIRHRWLRRYGPEARAASRRREAVDDRSASAGCNILALLLFGSNALATSSRSVCYLSTPPVAPGGRAVEK